MSTIAGPSPSLTDLYEFARCYRQWLDAHATDLEWLRERGTNLAQRVEGARKLQGILFDAGWARYGWPAGVGGLGGSLVHRALMFDELTRRFRLALTLFEHIEILAPTLVRYAPSTLSAVVLPDLLSGRRGWAQGFSEPDAGSDLAALRTRAQVIDDGYVVSGSKIWTSWAVHADWCLVLARTGSAEERHRGLTSLAVDLNSPGVTVREIRQANGNDEMAEVVFDDVFVPTSNVVGAVGRGWEVAMDILLNERGTFAWFRTAILYGRLVDSGFTACSPAALGDALLDLALARAGAIDSIGRSQDSDLRLEQAAIVKLLLTTAEQRLADVLLSAQGAGITCGSAGADATMMREEFQFSRIVSVYGGSRQIQLNGVARYLLRLPA
jgi:alkylation response protein AidB-like acyl-CoA dehydrogenase